MKFNPKYADIVLVVFVVAIAAMLIVPLPTGLLDILLVFNISFSILLLLVGLYLPSTGGLYTFPTVLLLSTLFRLGLNVASARLILSQGDAGRVIESFGTFLIRGEVLVGMIIFTIVTIVNFIVISRGATRVSEVAARFALDSLPGRQLAIDNDARAGLISADEARRKREDLGRDSQLYGSMDGAMKFVQGDAVAGFFIIVANIVGGIFMGLSNGMAVSEAIRSYTTLTIGDGLVTQIPSLLTSICAGIVVTRVASSDTSTLSSDLRAQIFSQPISIFITGIILLLFAILPGIPLLPFLSVALFAMVLGVLLMKKKGANNSLGLTDDGYTRGPGLPSPASREGDTDFDEPRIIIYLDGAVLFRAYRFNASKHLSWWQSFRNSFASDVGILLPMMRVQGDDLMPASSFRVVSSGVEMLSGQVLPDALLVEMSSSQGALAGLDVLREEEHPISGHRIFWALHTPMLRRMLEAASIRGLDFFEYIGLRIASFCLNHPDEFISVTDVHSFLRQVEKRNPGLIAEGFGKDFVSVPKLAEILQELVRQGVSIRDFRGIIEAVASYCAAHGISPENEQSTETSEIVGSIRTARRRQILRRYIGTARSLRVISLSTEAESTIAEAVYENRSLPLALETDVYDALVRGLEVIVRPAYELGIVPIAVICALEIREKVLSIARTAARPLFVLSFEELDPAIPVEQVGIWTLSYR